MLLTTNVMMEGDNPFSVENQPQYTNVYGIFYNIIVYPFAILFGSTLLVHRAVTAFFIISSCMLLFFIMYFKKEISLLYSFSGSLIFYASLLYFTTPVSRPDSLGIFLFLCSIVLPAIFEYSLYSSAISIILGVLGFYTKPYFVVAIIYITLYLFIFKSKKKGISYGTISLLILLLSTFIINYLFPCYFNNTIIYHINIDKEVKQEYLYSFKQFIGYIKWHIGIFLILFIHIISDLITKKRKILLQNKIRNYINLSNFRKPLLDVNIDIYQFAFICSSLLVFFKLGKHIGSWMVYLFQLISPFFIIITFSYIKEKVNFKLINILVIFINLLVISFIIFLPRLNQNYTEWYNLRQYTLTYKNILNSPAIVPLLIEQNKNIYDSGCSEYYIFGAKNKTILRLIWSKDKRILTRDREYKEDIEKAVRQKQFDLIILTKNYSPFISEKIIKKYYKYKETISINMKHVSEKWDLIIWEPQ